MDHEQELPCNDEDEILFEDHSSSPEDIYFDDVVAALQEIILDPTFEQVQTHFLRKHCSLFQDTEENKKEYMPVFALYQQEIERFVAESLAKRLPQFDMPQFLTLLQQRTDQIDEQILDMLQSFTDFETFKKVMLDYKAYLLDEESLKALTIKSNRLK